VMFRVVSAVMATLLGVAVAVQANDPDPVRWMALYGAACVLSVVAAVQSTAPWVAAAMVGVIALAWSAMWAMRVESRDTYAHMFDSWQMKSEPIEEARETIGLLLVAIWMAVVAVHSWRLAR